MKAMRAHLDDSRVVLISNKVRKPGAGCREERYETKAEQEPDFFGSVISLLAVVVTAASGQKTRRY
jgi:hypothetical protein